MTKKNGAGKQVLFCAAQNGQFYRSNLPPLSANDYTLIQPENTGEGLFITYFHLDNDNTDLLYYATEDSLFRTNNATTITPSTWTLMDSVHPKVFGGILARREEGHIAELDEMDIPPFDVVVVDLYPFEETVASGASET
jgi:hypothetical protein